MDEILHDLVIGVFGSLFGAFIIYTTTYGIAFSKKRKEKRAKKWEAEKSQWKSKQMGIRQGITNQYLFDILKYLLLGSIIGSFGTMIVIIDCTSNHGILIYRIILTVIGTLTFVIYLIGLGKVLRYLRLRKLDEE